MTASVIEILEKKAAPVWRMNMAARIAAYQPPYGFVEVTVYQGALAVNAGLTRASLRAGLGYRLMTFHDVVDPTVSARFRMTSRHWSKLMRQWQGQGVLKLKRKGLVFKHV